MPRIALLLLWLIGQPAFAHAPGLSSATITLSNTATLLNITLAPQDVEVLTLLDSDRDAEVSAQEWSLGMVRVAEAVARLTELSRDGQKLVSSVPPHAELETGNNVRIVLRYPGDGTGKGRHELRLHAALLDRLPAGHRQDCTVVDSSGRRVLEQVLTREQATLVAVLPDEAAGQVPSLHSSLFNDYLYLGIEHILTGYDHLLFLLGLLIATRGVWDYLSIISFFTLAHSLTLALATLNVVVLPANVVEPVIAASIVYVGVENLCRSDRIGNRGWLTFAFGLIHGFGFAGALQGVGINSGGYGLLIPLFAFNLGVEVGQLSVAALLLPALALLQLLRGSGLTLFSRWQSVCSGMIVVLGTYWLLERTLSG